MRVPDQPLGHPHCERWVAGNPRGQLARGVQQIGIGHHLRDQPDPQRLGRIDGFPGKGHLGGFGKPDNPLQQPGAAIARDDPQFDETLGKFGAFSGNPQIAHAGQIEPGSDRRAVDCSDHRHFERRKGQRQALDPAFVIAPRAGRQAGVEAARIGAHRFQVAAGGKSRSRAGQDRDADLGIVLDLHQGTQQRLDQIEIGDRVAQFGPVKRDRGNAIGIERIEDGGVRHAFLLYGQPTSR